MNSLCLKKHTQPVDIMIVTENMFWVSHVGPCTGDNKDWVALGLGRHYGAMTCLGSAELEASSDNVVALFL